MESKYKQRLYDLADQVEQDQQARDKFSQDPSRAIRDFAKELPEPLRTDVWIYRMVVVALGGAVLIAVVGAVLLAANELAIPEILLALGSAAIGALAGLLAPKPE